MILKGALAAMKQNDKHVYAEADAFRVRACNRDDVEVTGTAARIPTRERTMC